MDKINEDFIGNPPNNKNRGKDKFGIARRKLHTYIYEAEDGKYPLGCNGIVLN